MADSPYCNGEHSVSSGKTSRPGSAEAEVKADRIDADTPADVLGGLREADVIFHLAGVNRPKNEDEFFDRNTDFTAADASTALRVLNGLTTIVFSSSIQADLDNPYGVSKRKAEESYEGYAPSETGARVAIFRLPERLRQVVPAELQLGDRDLLPQHRARPADRD